MDISIIFMLVSVILMLRVIYKKYKKHSNVKKTIKLTLIFTVITFFITLTEDSLFNISCWGIGSILCYFLYKRER